MLYVPRFVPVFHVGAVLVNVIEKVRGVDWFSVSVAVIVQETVPIVDLIPVKLTDLSVSSPDNVPNPSVDDVMAYEMMGESEVASKFREKDWLMGCDAKFVPVDHVGGKGLLDFPLKSEKLMVPLTGIPVALL